MFTCASPSCGNPRAAYSTACLCKSCHWFFEKWGFPIAGYFGSLDLQRLGTDLMREIRPTQGDLTAALRVLRGSRYPVGPWEQRPAYRMAPLMTQRYNKRLPHLLVGRRKPPSIRSLSMALTHYLLGKHVLGTGKTYNCFLAGGSYYVRRAPMAPRSEDVLLGGSKAGYRLQRSDYTTIGREVLKACQCLGVDPDGRLSGNLVTSLYFAGLQAGEYRSSVMIPSTVLRSSAAGDSVFDHYIPSDLSAPRQYWGKVRRASGKIGREHPVGLDVHPEDRKHASTIHQNRKYHEANRVQTVQPPSTDWLFFNS